MKNMLRQLLHFTTHHWWFICSLIVLLSLLLKHLSTTTWHNAITAEFWLQIVIIFFAAVISMNLITKKVWQHTDSSRLHLLSWLAINWRLPLFLLALVFWLTMLYYLSSFVLIYVFYLISALIGNSTPMEGLFQLAWITTLFYLLARFCLVLPNAAMGRKYSFTSAWFDSSEKHIKITWVLAAAPLLCYWLTAQFLSSDQLATVWIRNLLISATVVYTLIVLSYVAVDSDQHK